MTCLEITCKSNLSRNNVIKLRCYCVYIYIYIYIYIYVCVCCSKFSHLEKKQTWPNFNVLERFKVEVHNPCCKIETSNTLH